MKPRFLIVDDDEVTRNLVSTILEANGCDVVAHDSGEAALPTLSDPQQMRNFEAVLLDVIMPGLSGLAVLERLRALPHGIEIPVLLLTARGKGEEIVEGYQLGASYYIQKPFTQEQLIYGLDTLLGDQTEEGGEKPVPVHRLDYNPDREDSKRSSGAPLLPQDGVKGFK